MDNKLPPLPPWEELEEKLQHITSLPREELEKRLLVCLKHLYKGMELMGKANESIKWLGETVVMLGKEVIFHQPRLEPETTQLMEQARRIASLDKDDG